MKLHLFIIEKQLCYPNPCKHNGTCTETGEATFVCNCDGVGYTGKTCEILLINAPKFSTLTVNSPIEFSMSSSPDREFILYLQPDDKKFLKVTPSSISFSQEHTHYNVSMEARRKGKYILKYVVKDQTLNYHQLPPATILVTDGTLNKSRYFDKHGVKLGLLKPGCCSSEGLLELKCPSSARQLFLKSTCGWTKKGPFIQSAGIIFSSSNRFDMPIAIAGAKTRQRKNSIDVLSLSKNEFQKGCTSCSNKNTVKPDARCDITSISLNDVQSFLCHESLAGTYFSHSSKLIPKWLKVNAVSSNRTHDIHSYMVNLVYPNDLTNIDECTKLTTVTDGLYSVLLYSGSLSIKFRKKTFQLKSNRSSVFCFAVNLCEEASSALYVTIPDEAQAVVQSLEIMRDLKSKGWSITINSFVISDTQISVSVIKKPIHYWNGKDFFVSYKKHPNIVTCIKFNKLFASSNILKANWVFSGNAYWFHDNINKVCVCMHNIMYISVINVCKYIAISF